MMQSSPDHDAHPHPHHDPHPEPHVHVHGQPPRAPQVQSTAPPSTAFQSTVIQSPASTAFDPGTRAAPSPVAASLFLAGSRERLMAAFAVVAVLWVLVWWALD